MDMRRWNKPWLVLIKKKKGKCIIQLEIIQKIHDAKFKESKTLSWVNKEPSYVLKLLKSQCSIRISSSHWSPWYSTSTSHSPSNLSFWHRLWMNEVSAMEPSLGWILGRKMLGSRHDFFYREKGERWVLKQKIWVKSVMGEHYLNVRCSIAVSENSTG